MIRKSKHTTQVPGVEELMQRIDGVQGVVKVKDRGIRTSRVSPRRREPEVMAAINRVVVTHYCGGSLQRIDVYPQRCVPVTVLKDRILAMLEHERQRGGVGMSSKAEIPIPERIRKLQRVACVPLAAASISPPAVGTIVTLVSEPLHAEDTVGSSNTPHPLRHPRSSTSRPSRRRSTSSSSVSIRPGSSNSWSKGSTHVRSRPSIKRRRPASRR